MPQVSAPILIDGSYGEGGGALIRTALCMSALTQSPVRIDNVRCGTAYPGLDSEDLLLLQALAASCSAETTGVDSGATSFSFLPTRRPAGLNLELLPIEGLRGANANIVLNSLVPVLSRAGVYSRVSAVGETYGHRSLSYDYFENVTLQAMRRLGIYAFPELSRAGFGREGKGAVAVEVEPSVIQGFKWEERGRMMTCQALIVSSHLPREIADRGASHLKNLGKSASIDIDVEHDEVRSDRPGVHMTVWATFERGLGGASVMGSKGVRVESVAQSVFEELFQWLRIDATVDPFLADQILLPACFAESACSFTVSKLTERFMTSVWVIKQFLPIHITVKGSVDGPGSVSIRR